MWVLSGSVAVTLDQIAGVVLVHGYGAPVHGDALPAGCKRDPGRLVHVVTVTVTAMLPVMPPLSRAFTVMS